MQEGTKYELNGVTCLIKALQWLSISLKLKARVLEVTHKSAAWSGACQISPPTMHSPPPATWPSLVSLDMPGVHSPQGLCTCYSFFLECASPRLPVGSLPHHLQVFPQMSAFLWVFSWLTILFKIITFYHLVSPCLNFSHRKFHYLPYSIVVGDHGVLPSGFVSWV